jgi:hypothetical protein
MESLDLVGLSFYTASRLGSFLPFGFPFMIEVQKIPPFLNSIKGGLKSGVII